MGMDVGVGMGMGIRQRRRLRQKAETRAEGEPRRKPRHRHGHGHRHRQIENRRLGSLLKLTSWGDSFQDLQARVFESSSLRFFEFFESPSLRVFQSSSAWTAIRLFEVNPTDLYRCTYR